MTLRIGTRGSDLARWQAQYVANALEIHCRIEIIKTAGDEIQHLSLDKLEGKGFFTKEIEAALLAERVDVAVHSYKDLPVDGPAGLRIAAVPARGPVKDVVVTGRDLAQTKAPLGLPAGATVGTSSLRRKAQVLAVRPDLELVDLRGNVPTRFGKATGGELDAVILAEAGLRRLGLLEHTDARCHPVDIVTLCPAPAQGALAIQIRAGDAATGEALAALHHEPTARAVETERRLLARFGGGCHLPLGAWCATTATGLELLATVAAPDGSERLEARGSGSDITAVVDAVHEKLIRDGAERYL